MRTETRRLEQLVSIGPAMLRDFELLGIRSVPQLARQNPEKLYKRLCDETGQKHDICCLDVFHAAVAQARDPRLPLEQCHWWYWSRKRKSLSASDASSTTGSRATTVREWSPPVFQQPRKAGNGRQ